MLEELTPEHLIPADRCREILEAAGVHCTEEKVEIFAQDAFNAVGVLAVDLFFKSHDWTRKPADPIPLDYPDHRTDEQIDRMIDSVIARRESVNQTRARRGQPSLGRPKEPIWLFLRTFLGLAYLFGIKPKVSAREPHGRFFDLLTSSVKTIMEPLQADAVRVGSAEMNERLVGAMTKLFNANAVKTAINRLHDQTPRP